jgi:Spy/CpxP family protein refolding chaperone
MKGDKTMRKYIFIIGILLLAAVLVFPLMAISEGTGTGNQTMATCMGKERGHWMGRAASDLTAEQREQIKKLHEKFREDNADTRKQLMTKHFDLKTALNADKPDVDKAKAIQKEISDLNAKLAQKRIDLYQEIRKINPNARFRAGMERGHRRLGLMGRMRRGMGA